jgi:hypothetical protein
VEKQPLRVVNPAITGRARVGSFWRETSVGVECRGVSDSARWMPRASLRVRVAARRQLQSFSIIAAFQ